MSEPSNIDHIPGHLAPPQIRPSLSRQNSGASARTNISTISKRPHAQHKDYIAAIDGFDAIIGGGEGGGQDATASQWMFDDPEDTAADELAKSRAQSHSQSPETVSEDGQEDANDWDNLRDGSIARRPAWRRPSPKWIYPFIVGATLTMGMGMAPRQELYISLACLAHPPQQPSAYENALRDVTLDTWRGEPVVLMGQNPMSINATIPVTPSPHPEAPRSAVDEWFIKIQHDIYEYELTHHHTKTTPQSPTSSTSRAMPTVPLPHPTSPSEGDRTPIETQPPEEEPKPDTSQPADSPPYHQIDPSLCKKDPRVQAAAARLTMTMTLAMGILSALTTGFWGQTSDRIGRSKVMAIVESGLLMNELCFVLVATFPYLAPGGYRALLIGPTIDGLLGGFATIMATIHAYMSDVTPDGSRATVFARLSGIMMAGFAFGPVLGSTLIRLTGNIMFPFYISICVHGFYILLMLFLLPESLSTEARSILSKNVKLAAEAARRRDIAEQEWENVTPIIERNDPFSTPPRTGILKAPNTGNSGWTQQSNVSHSKRRKRAAGNTRRIFRRIFRFLQPLAIFLPRERDDGQGKDWALTLMGASMGAMSMMFGIMQTKTQFAFFAYGWTSAQLGPFMSLAASLRALTLLALVPAIMHYLKPRFTHNATAAPIPDPGASALSSSSSSSSPTASTPAKRSSKLDLLTMKFCLSLQITVFAILATNVSATTFVIVSAFGTLGSADAPAFNSLALSLLPSSREAGRLFGALSVIHAIFGTLISPLIFGSLFAYTVGIYAPTVFALVAFLLCISLVLICMIRLPEEHGARVAERGRSRNIKRVKSSGGGVGLPK